MTHFRALWPHREGRRVSEVVRALTSHECGLGSIPARYFMWVEFVAGFRFAPRVFLLILRFSSLHKKPNTLNYNSTRIEDPHGNQLRLMQLCFELIYLFIHLFIYLFIYLSIYLFIILLIIFIYSFIHLFIYLFIHLFIYLLIYVAGTTQSGA